MAFASHGFTDPLIPASSCSSPPQVAETETGREASGGAGGSGANAQAGAGRATRPTYEGPAGSLQRNAAVPIQRTAGVPLLRAGSTQPTRPPTALRGATDHRETLKW